MKRFLPLLLLVSIISCNNQLSKKNDTDSTSTKKDTLVSNFVMVVASCNHQYMEQPLWKAIRNNQPDVFVWGGDNIYADTENMDTMALKYRQLKTQEEYAQLLKETTVIGTWDDHDYGKNDAGVEWAYKAEAQQLFLDFINVPEADSRREREGVYHSETFTSNGGSVKVILLDTRYFRDALKKNPEEGRRYQQWGIGEGGTILGKAQWNWLEKELQDDTADFTMIVSSIQFIANEHPWEQWGNFPDEVFKMEQLLVNAKAKNIFIVSGDRHSAEISVKNIKDLSYPLVDFTTSGMTKTYPNNPDDLNQYRIGRQVKQLNFGLLEFDFKIKKVTMEIRGKNNIIYEKYEFGN